MDDEGCPHSWLTNGFDQRMVFLLRSSYIVAKFDLPVIYQFSSKYALALYETIARQIKLNNCVEEFSSDYERRWFAKIHCLEDRRHHAQYLKDLKQKAIT